MQELRTDSNQSQSLVLGVPASGQYRDQIMRENLKMCSSLCLDSNISKVN